MGFVLNRDSRGRFGKEKKKKKKTRQGIFVFLPARAPQHSLTSAKKEEKRLLYVFFPHPESQVRDVARVLMRGCVCVCVCDKMGTQPDFLLRPPCLFLQVQMKTDICIHPTEQKTPVR